MAKVAYVPYDEDMDTIFTLLNVSISTSDFGGVTGWYNTDYSAARGAAWAALTDLDTFDYDEDGEDDWDEVAELLTGDYQIFYWSTEQGHDPS